MLKIETSEITSLFYNNFFQFRGGDVPCVPPWRRLWLYISKLALCSSKCIPNGLNNLTHPAFSMSKHYSSPLFCYGKRREIFILFQRVFILLFYTLESVQSALSLCLPERFRFHFICICHLMASIDFIHASTVQNERALY